VTEIERQKRTTMHLLHQSSSWSHQKNGRLDSKFSTNLSGGTFLAKDGFPQKKMKTPRDASQFDLTELHLFLWNFFVPHSWYVPWPMWRPQSRTRALGDARPTTSSNYSNNVASRVHQTCRLKSRGVRVQDVERAHKLRPSASI